MAVGWITVLSSIPWNDVIKNAPKVAVAAKKLWSTVAKKASSPDEPAGQGSQTALSPDFKIRGIVESRLAALETDVSDLNSKMLASSELIKALAEQNTQLIRRIEVNRIRMRWLTAATVLIAIITLLCLLLTLSR